MNIFRVILFSVLLLSPLSAQDFEGMMTFSVTGQGQSQSFDYFSKGDKIRFEMEQAPGMRMAVLMEMKSGTVTMLMPATKMYMRVNVNDMGSTGEEGQEFDFQWTDKKETILGYSCQQVIITQESGQSEVWVTKGLGKFMQASFTGRPKSPAVRRIEEELTAKGYFPLRMVTRLPNGSEQVRMEVTAVQKKKLSDDLFAIPAGYQEMQMPPRQ